MQRLSGLLLILAGGALAAYAYLTPPDTAAQEQAATAETAETAPPVYRDWTVVTAPDRSFSPRVALGNFSQRNPPAPSKPLAVQHPSRPAQTARAREIAALPATRQATGWTSVVTSSPSAQNRLRSSKPGDGQTRAQLARDLQIELKRVGCYSGEITGAWTPSTKRAMSTFLDRVNATLPYDEPDYILLTLVQGRAGPACGAECPSGEVMVEDERCVPRAVVAQASRKSQHPDERRLAAADRTGASANWKSTARGKPEAVTAAPGKTVDFRRTAVATAEVAEELPWRKAPTSPAPLAVSRPAPLPGLMAVGAPRAAVREAPAAMAPAQAAPGTKSAVALRDPAAADQNATVGATGEVAPPAPGTRPAHTVRHPARGGAGNRNRTKSYSDASSAKQRRGEARPGTPRYNLMQSLGGVF